MYNIYQKYRSIIIILVKLLIVIAAFYFISKKIISAKSVYQSGFSQHIKTILIKNPHFILLIFGFTFVNWFFEILKWKTLVNSVKNISFLEAYKQSTFSLTASLLTPNRIGEYGAKAIYYNKYQRKKVMFLNLIGNLSQMLITVFFGIIGFILISRSLNIEYQKINWIVLFTFLLLVFFILYRLRNYIRSVFLTKIKNYFKSIPVKDLKQNLKYSLFRYLIFSHQFYFLLVVFGVDLDYFSVMGAIFSIYFIASVIPGFVAFDFIVKGSIAISVFGLFGVPELLILGITTLMWLLNFSLPAIIGSYFVFTFELPQTAKITVE